METLLKNKRFEFPISEVGLVQLWKLVFSFRRMLGSAFRNFSISNYSMQLLCYSTINDPLGFDAHYRNSSCTTSNVSLLASASNFPVYIIVFAAALVHCNCAGANNVTHSSKCENGRSRGNANCDTETQTKFCKL